MNRLLVLWGMLAVASCASPLPELPSDPADRCTAQGGLPAFRPGALSSDGAANLTQFETCIFNPHQSAKVELRAAHINVQATSRIMSRIQAGEITANGITLKTPIVLNYSFNGVCEYDNNSDLSASAYNYHEKRLRQSKYFRVAEEAVDVDCIVHHFPSQDQSDFADYARAVVSIYDRSEICVDYRTIVETIVSYSGAPDGGIVEADYVAAELSLMCGDREGALDLATQSFRAGYSRAGITIAHILGG